MNKTDFTITTIKLTTADREKLAAWAKENISNMSAEIARSIRERAARE